MNCPVCGQAMNAEVGLYEWNVRTWFCELCDREINEDVTGELIDVEWEKRGDL
jgi:transposase-like protein